MAKLTVRKIGNSAGVILPAELLSELNVKVGDELFVTHEADSLRISPYDDEFAQQMEVAREIMREDRDVLRLLAK